MFDVDRYQVMLKCWKYVPEQRYSFPDVVQQLDGILLKASNTVSHTYCPESVLAAARHDSRDQIHHFDVCYE